MSQLQITKDNPIIIEKTAGDWRTIQITDQQKASENLERLAVIALKRAADRLGIKYWER